MDLFVGIINNPITLYAVGLVFARFPVIRTAIANKWIPLIQTIVAWVALVTAPAAAHAAGGPLAVAPVAVAGFSFFSGLSGPIGGALSSLAAAAWQAAQAHLLHRMFGRPLLGPDPSDSRR